MIAPMIGKMGMIKTLDSILKDIEKNTQDVVISFNDDIWGKNLPSKSGWYWIKTNTPIAVLESVGKPSGKAHINIPKTITETLKLSNLVITQSNNSEYIIYNGQAKYIRARAKEHFDGHQKTFCLGIKEYKNSFEKYNWVFSSVTLSKITGENADNKIKRILVEQAWRPKNGWQIFCKK
jgi:hypothetical protein